MAQPPVPRSFRRVRVGAVGAALALLAGCGGDSTDDTTTAASATTTAAAPTATTAAPTTAAPTTTVPSVRSLETASSGSLAGGKYTASGFKPTFTITLEDRTVTRPDKLYPDALDFLSPSFSDATPDYFGILRPAEVLTDPYVRDPVERNGNGRTAPVPKDFVAWLRSNDAITVGPETQKTVDGRPAHVVTVTPKPVAPGAGGCSPPVDRCTVLWRYSNPGLYFALYETETVIVIDMPDGGPVIVTMGGSAAFQAKAMKAVDSIDFA